MRTLAMLVGCAAAALAQGQVTVVRNATLHTITKGSFPGTLVFQNGKIVEAGEKVMTPPGAVVIDAGGGHVTPGIIDSHTHIASDGTNEGSIVVTSMVQMRDVINPEHIAIYRALAGGVTTANVLHGSANPIGGQNILIKLRWGKKAEEMVFEGATPSIKFALGENVKRSGVSGTLPGGARYPATRLGVEDVFREAFAAAKAYQKAWREFRAGVTKEEPRRDLQLEPLVEVLEGKRIVHCHAYRADEMLMALRVADEFGFKIASFEHVQEGYKVAKEMKEHGVTGAGFSDWWAYKMEVIDGIPYNMAVLVKKGAKAAINSDSLDGALMRRLNTEAAKTVKYGGLTEQQALELITINPARHLKIDHLVGSLEAGKSADFVIWNKHPLSSYAVAEKVFIDGQAYFDRGKDMAGRAALAERKKALVEKLRGTDPPPVRKGRAGEAEGERQ